jgi:hypothetical protein
MKIIGLLRFPCIALAIMGSLNVSAKEVCTGELPYRVDVRPAARAKYVEAVLPSRIGRFQRADLKRDLAIPTNEDFNVTYRAGASWIFVGISRPGSLADQQEAVRTSREDALSDPKIDKRGELYCTRGSRPYYKHSSFMAWTNGDLFIYADGSTPGALDEFMRSFKF